MFFNFGLGETYDVILELFVGNQVVERQKLTGPSFFLQQQFFALMQEVMKYTSPRKIRMSRFEQVWSQIDKEMKILELYIEFQNWREEEKNEENS